jgi:predicted O-methyltransferase YrrM
MNVNTNEAQQVGKDMEEAARHAKIQTKLLPGEQYTTWLQWFHNTLQPKNYLEIGVNTGTSLQYATSDYIIGVDPDPRLEHDLNENTKVFDIESDTFFKTQDVQDLVNGKIELAFVDGLHQFDQVLKDFINIERNSTKDTVVLFHDIYPVVPETATREWNTYYWAGDTWKFMHIINKYRPDIVVRTIPTFPTGLGFATNLEPSSNILKDNYVEIVEEFMDLEYNLHNPVNLVTNNFKDIEKCLR